jgi:hypothetical protein
MSFVSVTRLRLRRFRHVPPFAFYTLLTLVQARRSKGNLTARAIRQDGLVFWTITLWSESDAMRAFRNRGWHGRVMPKLADWCDEATYVNWRQEDSEPPDLPHAYQRLISEGVASRVRYPSPNHLTRAFPPP